MSLIPPILDFTFEKTGPRSKYVARHAEFTNSKWKEPTFQKFVILAKPNIFNGFEMKDNPAFVEIPVE